MVAVADGEGICFLGTISGEIFFGEEAAVGLDLVEYFFCDLAAIEAVDAFDGDLAEDFGEVLLDDAGADRGNFVRAKESIHGGGGGFSGPDVELAF